MAARRTLIVSMATAVATVAAALAAGCNVVVAGVVGLAAALAAAGTIAIIQTRDAAALTALADAIRRLGAGELSLRVYAGGPRAVTDLARSINAAAEELEIRFRHLETDRRQLRAILGGMVEGVVLLDATQQVLYFNQRAADLLDIPAAAVGKKFWEVVRHRRLQELVAESLTSESPAREELEWHGPSPRDLAAYAARLAGKPAPGAVLVLHDVTELHRLERVRSEFVANVSHELKTPLTVIQVNAETLLAGAMDDTSARTAFLNEILAQADRLHALILDLLDLARIESGAETWQMEPVRLDALAAEAVERFRKRADARRQTLELAATTSESAAWADREAVSTIVANLLDNAIKYTPEGGRVAVRAFLENGVACLEVSDTGIGIPDAELPRIFERFYRVDKARSRELGGTGLGLSIVKHLTQAMKGSVSVESHPDVGSRFTVRLPAAASSGSEPEFSTQPSSKLHEAKL